MTHDQHQDLNLLEDINRICRAFRRQFSQGKPPRLETFLLEVGPDGRENLFSNLLEIELNYRRSKKQNPTSSEYLKRFPNLERAIRRAFFEPTVGSYDSANDEGGATRSLVDADGRSDDSPTFSIPDANRLGTYELVSVLGRGGMGVVYEARNLKNGNRIALKTLPIEKDGRENNAEKLYRFRREFRQLSEINHPNLVGMQTLEVEGNQWFFTMDLIEGQDFLSYVRPDGVLDETRLRSALKQLAQGIMALHQRRIVHRDIKPSNVMVDETGVVKILDFGLVAELQHYGEHTASLKSAQFAGTPRYAAPEQMFGQRSESSDWYAFGVMLYEALTGSPPFQGNHFEVLKQKQNEDSPQLAGRLGYPSDLAALTDRMLQREPINRPMMAEIADRLGMNLETRGSVGSTDSATDEEPIESSSVEQLLVGRDEQLAELNSAKDELLRMHRACSVMITGLSGEGKSALAESFLHPLRLGSEIVVLSGRCYDRESVPFKAIDCWIDSLVSFLRSLTSDQQAALLPNDIAMLAHIFPMLRRVASIADRCGTAAPTVDSKQIRYRAFAALQDLLSNISSTVPIVLFVDDLQWGDADSAEAIACILAASKAPAVMFLGSYRRDEAEDSPFLKAWQRTWDDKPHQIPQQKVELQPLTPEQCLELVAERVGIPLQVFKDQAGDFFADTQGNPYFVEQLIEGYDPVTSSFRAVPLNEVIATKLNRLPPNAAKLLDVIALAGKAVSLSEASQVAGNDRLAFETITHMRSERLVRLVGSGDRQLVDTYHDKIREVRVSQMPTAVRSELHLTFAKSIQTNQAIDQVAVEAFLSQSFAKQNVPRFSTERIYDLAYHFYLAGDSRASVFQLLSGELAFQTYASDEAIQFLSRAVSLLSEKAPKSWRARLWHRLAVSSSRLMNFDRAIEQFESGIEFAEQGLEKAFYYFGIATVHQTRSNYDLATEYQDLALSAIKRKRPTGLSAVLTTAFEFGKLYFFPESWLRGNSADANDESRLEQAIYRDVSMYLFDRSAPLIEWPAAVMRMGILSHKLQRSAMAFGVALTAAWIGMCGFPKLGQRLSKRAKANLGESPDPEAEGVFRMASATAISYSGEFCGADEEYTKSIPLLLRAGSYHFCASGLHMQRHLREVIGPASSEVEAARQLLDLATASRDMRGLLMGHYDYAGGLARLGRLEESFNSIEVAQKVWEQLRVNLITPIYFSQRSFVLLQGSQYELARKSADFSWRFAIRHVRVMDVCLRGLAWYLECIAGPRWPEKPFDLNQKLVRSRCRWARTLAIFHIRIRPHLYRARGRALFSLGKKRKGTKSLEIAVQSARELGMKYELAKSLLDLAAVKSLGREENRKEAIRLLNEMTSVIPRAEAWLLGDQHDESVIAPEFDLAAWERQHGPLTPTSELTA